MTSNIPKLCQLFALAIPLQFGKHNWEELEHKLPTSRSLLLCENFVTHWAKNRGRMLMFVPQCNNAFSTVPLSNLAPHSFTKACGYGFFLVNDCSSPSKCIQCTCVLTGMSPFKLSEQRLDLHDHAYVTGQQRW